LGLSSFQLSDKERGFSFDSKNFLNMEMGINEYSAYDVINTLDKEHLATIIKVLGEEKDGKIIANKIVRYRAKKAIKTSGELVSVINNAKKNYNKYKKNPATKTFQAIRIFVNQELTELILGLIGAAKLLSNEGILIVVSFHSLEDQIVKNFFNLYSNLRKNPSRYLPIKETAFPNCDKPTIEFATEPPAIVSSIVKFDKSFLNSISSTSFIVLLVRLFLFKKFSSTLQTMSTIAFPIPSTFTNSIPYFQNYNIFL